jgi:hypothetical protein
MWLLQPENTGWLAALMIYLWAGYWMARPAFLVPTGMAPAWARMISFVVAWLGWAVLFPIHFKFREEQRKKEVR